MAIMEYINDVRPEASLLPKDPKSRAKVSNRAVYGHHGVYQ